MTVTSYPPSGIVGTTSAPGGGASDASAANQLTEIARLTSILANTPAVGRALAAASAPATLSTEDFALLTAIRAAFPLALGRAAAASSLTTVLSTEDKAAVDAITALKATTGLTNFAVNIATAGDLPIVAAVAGQTTRVHRLSVAVAGPVTLTLKSGATVLRTKVCYSAGDYTLDYSLVPWAVTGVNTALNLGLSAAVQVTGDIETVTGV